MTLQSISVSGGTDVPGNVERVRRRIDDAARRHHRDPQAITLIAVSKTQPAERIRQAAAAGCRHFGENYLQEAEAKVAELKDLPLVWHFIGAIQSNKTRAIAASFHWVHTVSRLKIAERLSAQCPPGHSLDVTIQVNIDDDPDKAGIEPAAAGELVTAMAALPNLRLRGLMTVLKRAGDAAPAGEALASYRRLQDLFRQLAPSAPATWDTLSMGMTGDFEDAIGAGSTHVRIGTALFGPRTSR